MFLARNLPQIEVVGSLHPKQVGDVLAVRSMSVSEAGAPLARLSDGTVWLLHAQLRAWLLVAGRESPAAAFASLIDPSTGVSF